MHEVADTLGRLLAVTVNNAPNQAKRCCTLPRLGACYPAWLHQATNHRSNIDLRHDAVSGQALTVTQNRLSTGLSRGFVEPKR